MYFYSFQPQIDRYFIEHYDAVVIGVQVKLISSQDLSYRSVFSHEQEERLDIYVVGWLVGLLVDWLVYYFCPDH